MSRALHWLAHRFGWNEGGIVFARSAARDRVGVAFRCSGCGKVSGAHWTHSFTSWAPPEWAGKDIPADEAATMRWGWPGVLDIPTEDTP